MVEPADSLGFEKLTPREREILRLIAQHQRSKEIARLLSLSPKTVEMHVLSARRRLAGMPRRDAALAFVAWEQTPGSPDPGNDYRRQSPDLAVELEQVSPGFNSGSGHGHERQLTQDGPFGRSQFSVLHRELEVAGRGPDPDGGHSRAGAPGAGDGFGAAQGAGGWGSSVEAAAAGARGDGLPVGRQSDQVRTRGGWRHDLTPAQWMGLILVSALAAGVLLSVVTMGAHEFLYALQRFREGWSAPPAH